MSSTEISNTDNAPLTEAQKARINRNRERALHLKAAKLTSHPYAKADIDAAGKSTIKVQGTKFVDGGGGFLIEQSAFPRKKDDGDVPLDIPDEAIQIPPVYEKCLDCEELYTESYLMNSFGHSVCDKCRDSDDKHSLITRTEAKAEYLLKDCDFDKREPALRFISRKNPHNERWGEMKLYLHLQVEKRALEVWGSEDDLIKEHELRDEKRDKTKLKKYNKNLKQLRMETRSSLFDRTSAVAHTHTFGEERYNEPEDIYEQNCVECGFLQSYEKM